MKQDFKIAYTSRDFDSIKSDLVNYAKRYYSNTITDFTDSSVMSLLLDSIAYAGDVISFSIDYNTNETFLDSAIEKENILKIGSQVGYKQKNYTGASGKIALYMLLPVKDMEPDYSYSPTIRKGSRFKSLDGTTFLLTNDIKITKDIINTQYTVAQVNPTTNAPTYYAVKFYADVVSGDIVERTIGVGDFTKFLTVKMRDVGILEILSVIDAEGNEYYEVESLSQDIVYKLINNYDNSANSTRFFKPIHAPRRFNKYINAFNEMFLTFGGIGKYNVSGTNPVFEPSKTALQQFGREYFTDTYLEPSKLVNGDNYGIGPSNTTLTIRYRVDNSLNNSLPPNSINKVDNLLYFLNTNDLNITAVNNVINSIEITNEETIVNNNISLTTKELKDQIGSYNQAQNRAVTDRDYESFIYSAPSVVGSIRRTRVMRDKNSLRNNLNIYVLSTDSSDSFVNTSYDTKLNLKNYLNNYRILTDTIDILDAKVINIGINFEIIADPNYNEFDVLRIAKEQLKFVYSNKMYIGESFSVNEVYKNLRKIKGLLDVKNVEIVNKTGLTYRGVPFNIEKNMTNDNRFVVCPQNCVFEIRYLDSDIQGYIK